MRPAGQAQGGVGDAWQLGEVRVSCDVFEELFACDRSEVAEGEPGEIRGRPSENQDWEGEGFLC